MRRPFGHTIRRMPVVVLNLVSACDSRCVACDYWRGAGAERSRLGGETIQSVLGELEALETRYVLLSGGEPLVHSDLPRICELLHDRGFFLLLHTNGLRLAERLSAIGPYLSHLFVSLDAVAPETYFRIRGVDGASRVIAAIRLARSRFPELQVGSRTVLLRDNVAELERIVELGLQLGLRPISFLAADTHSDAFGRRPGPRDHLASVLPSGPELDALAGAIDALVRRWGPLAEDAIEGGVASLRRILARYRRLARGEAPRAPRCNAPWHSAVIEPDGAVRPCFFQPAYGSLKDGPLRAILNASDAARFRRNLNVGADPLCRYCVCSKHFRSSTLSP